MGHIAHKTNSSNQWTHLRKAMITITLLKIEKKAITCISYFYFRIKWSLFVKSWGLIHWKILCAKFGWFRSRNFFKTSSNIFAISLSSSLGKSFNFDSCDRNGRLFGFYLTRAGIDNEPPESVQLIWSLTPNSVSNWALAVTALCRNLTDWCIRKKNQLLKKNNSYNICKS